jgi:hypothetical protein
MRLTIMALLAAVIVSCEKDSGVRFETPQPEGQRDEQSIPKKIIGSYRSLSDSSVLTITSTQITKSFNGRYSGLVSELDSIDKIAIKNDTYFSEVSGNLRSKIVVKGDSLFESVQYTDTIFLLSKSDVLRKFKGYLFINRETSPDRWSVTKIGIIKNSLILGTILSKEDLEHLRELTNTRSDSIHEFRPTKKQLKQFIKEKGFQHEEQFIKIGGR